MQKLNIPLIMVVGYQKEVIEETLTRNNVPASYIEQTNARGTGHAVLVSRPLWTADHLLIVNGDGPLINEELIKSVIEKHLSTQATVTFVTAYNTDPTLSVARVIKNDGKTTIVEHKDFEGDRNQPASINAGIYLMKRDFVEAHIEHIPPYKNGELGIPELIHKAVALGKKVEMVDVPLDYVRGVNTQKELSIAEHIKRSDIIESFMNKGVRFVDERSTIIDHAVTVAPDTVIGAGVHLLKNTTVGSNCTIGAYSILTNCLVEDNAVIGSHCVLTNAHIHENAEIRALTHANGPIVGCSQGCILNSELTYHDPLNGGVMLGNLP